MTNFYHTTQIENKFIFCEMIHKMILSLDASIFIVADLRHHFELDYFAKLKSDDIRVITIRLTAPDSIRSQRGWIESPIDRDDTETNLDDHQTWDFVYANSESMQALESFTEKIVSVVI